MMRRDMLAGMAWVCMALAGFAQAHEFRVGDVVIDHPYAIPSPPGSPNGAMYLRGLQNRGEQADRLLGARTPVAASVEIHHMETDAASVMRMRAVPALELPAGARLSLRHGGAWHLMLLNLKAPLQVGDRFPVTLRFERAGEREINVWVQRVGDTEHVH